MLANDQISYLPYDDYAQSANTLFHFMTKQEYLDSILRRRAIIPRYCIETIDYLNIHNGTRVFNEAAILQKCFCDIDELYLLLCEKKVVRLDAKLTSTDSTSVAMNRTETPLSIGSKIALTFLSSIELNFLKQTVTLHTANLLVNALVKDIQESDDGTVKILYGDTDSKPMYISFSAFETSEEAKQESDTILQHDEIYVNALTSNAYINQYYEGKH